MHDGWISLHRKFLEWEWFSDNNMVKLFIYLLLKANHSTNTWKGIEIKRGQLLTGLDQLNFQTKISIQTLRTCLKRLENTQEINMQVTNKYRIITICNYDSYQTVQQATNKQTNKQLTSNQQTTNKQLTANNNVNKENNVNKVNNKSSDLIFTYQKFITLFNEITGRNFKGCSKSEHQFNARIKKYNEAEFGIAIRSAHKDDYLRQNPKYLTPEYISRENQMEKWLNVIEGEKKGTIYDINPDISKDPNRLKWTK